MIILMRFIFILAFPILALADNDGDYKQFSGSGLDSEVDYSFQIYQHQIDLRTINLPICVEHNFDITKCEPSVCRSVTGFGKVLSKIKGIAGDGKCEYVERTPGVDGVNCSFPTDKLDRVNILFEKRFEKLSGSAVEFSDTEVKELEDIFKNDCTFVKDYSQRKKVSMEPGKQSDDIDPEFVVTDFERYSNIVRMVQDIKSKEAGDQVDTTDPLDSYKSIMFSKREMDLVNLILEATYGSGNSKSATLFASNSLGNFYLGSILYYTQEKWSIWVNGKRYTSDEPTSMLSVDSVSPERARITWNAGDLDRISPTWRSKLIPAAGGKYISKQYDISVKGKEEHMQITFSLKPNQTFDITSMSILEGRI
jgi:hypothetical protein